MHEGANLNIIERVGYYEAVGLCLFEFWNLITEIIPISRNTTEECWCDIQISLDFSKFFSRIYIPCLKRRLSSSSHPYSMKFAMVEW